MSNHGSFVTLGARKYTQLAPPSLLFHVSLRGYLSWNSNVTESVNPLASFLVRGSKNCSEYVDCVGFGATNSLNSPASNLTLTDSPA